MRSFLFLASVALATLPAVGWANMADPYRPGDRPGELIGSVDDLRVERETLTFDLREIPAERRAHVEAVYEIENETVDGSVDLQFVAAGLSADRSEIEVELDGESIPVDVEREAPVPPEWALDEDGVGQRDDQRTLEEHTLESLFFRLDLRPGEHRIRVSYPVRPDHEGFAPGSERLEVNARGVKNYSIPYVVAPLHEWGEVGEIEVVVRPPDGPWEVATEPELERRDDGTLATAFDEAMPLDTIFVITQRTSLYKNGGPIVGLLVAGLVLLICVSAVPVGLAWLRRRYFARPGMSRPLQVTSVVVALLLTAVVGLLAVPLACLAFETWFVTKHASPGRSYALGVYSMVGAPLAFGFALIIYGLGDLLPKLREEREEDR
ncbi:MAG: hypothetical protein ACOCV2_06200 [Persicimonas sp.]